MTTRSVSPNANETLGDEGFMSADDLRAYMDEMTKAKRNAQDSGGKGIADQARKDLIKSLSKPIDVTPKVIADLKKNLVFKMRDAASRGEKEIMVLRFPNSLCKDEGRAINNSEEGWPDTLTGRPRQAYEFWRDHLRSANYKLKAAIIEWPGGLPGDVGFFLTW
jgi:polyhydroxyalkanoate synthesis regulator phasin